MKKHKLPFKVDRKKFDNTPFIKKIPKPWGYELLFTLEHLPYSGKVLHIEAGKRLSLQVHDEKQESYIILSGKCNLILENKDGELEIIEMETGMGYTTKVGQRHRHHAVTDVDVFEVAMPETGNTYRLEDDYSRPDETEDLRRDPNRGWDK
jgi:mannose-6-phosphate isomerase